MKLYALGELSETSVDLHHMNAGKPEVYNDFFTVCERVIQDWVAEDDQRHGVAHLSKFISIHDLHEEVKGQFAPDVLVHVPLQKWL